MNAHHHLILAMTAAICALHDHYNSDMDDAAADSKLDEAMRALCADYKDFATACELSHTLKMVKR